MPRGLGISHAGHAIEARNAIWKAVTDFFDENGYSPSLKEIGEMALYSRGTIVRYLDVLEARGVLTRHHNYPRSIRLLKPYTTGDRLPDQSRNVVDFEP